MTGKHDDRKAKWQESTMTGQHDVRKTRWQESKMTEKYDDGKTQWRLTPAVSPAVPSRRLSKRSPPKLSLARYSGRKILPLQGAQVEMSVHHVRPPRTQMPCKVVTPKCLHHFPQTAVKVALTKAGCQLSRSGSLLHPLLHPFLPSHLMNISHYRLMAWFRVTLQIRTDTYFWRALNTFLGEERKKANIFEFIMMQFSPVSVFFFPFLKTDKISRLHFTSYVTGKGRVRYSGC